MKQIVVSDDCHSKLNGMKQHKRESYGDVVDKLIKEHQQIKEIIGNQTVEEYLKKIEIQKYEKLQSEGLSHKEEIITNAGTAAQFQ